MKKEGYDVMRPTPARTRRALFAVCCRVGGAMQPEDLRNATLCKRDVSFFIFDGLLLGMYLSILHLFRTCV